MEEHIRDQFHFLIRELVKERVIHVKYCKVKEQ